MDKQYMVVSINHDTQKAVLQEVIKCKTKAKGERVEFLGKTPLFRDLDIDDCLGRVYTLTQSFK